MWHPFLYRKQLGEFDAIARPGDLVELISAAGFTQGFGLFNPRAEMTVRLLRQGVHRPDEAWWHDRLASALELRRGLLQLDSVTDAYRVVHAEADGLPGLIVDRFGDVLVAECFSLGMYQRAEAILSMLEPLCGTRHGVMRAAPASQDHEGFSAEPTGSEGLPPRCGKSCWQRRNYGTTLGLAGFFEGTADRFQVTRQDPEQPVARTSDNPTQQP